MWPRHSMLTDTHPLPSLPVCFVVVVVVVVVVWGFFVLFCFVFVCFVFGCLHVPPPIITSTEFYTTE